MRRRRYNTPDLNFLAGNLGKTKPGAGTPPDAGHAPSGGGNLGKTKPGAGTSPGAGSAPSTGGNLGKTRPGAGTRSGAGSSSPTASSGPAPLPAVLSPLAQLADILSPGPTAHETAEAAHRLGVKPKEAPQHAADAVASEFAKFTKAVTQEAEKVAKLPSELPKKRVDSLLGRPTLGKPTVAQLIGAAVRGKIRLNQRGKLTIPATRQAARKLTKAKRAAHAGGIEGITHGPEATRFANALAKYTGLNPRAIGAWVQAEGGGFSAGGEAGKNNWLGVGYPGEQTPFSQSAYFNGTPEQAAKATADWMMGKVRGVPGYDYTASSGIQEIIPKARHGSAQDFIRALSESGWGTNVSSVAQNLGMIRAAPANPLAVQNLQQAKLVADRLGIPTQGASPEQQHIEYLKVFGKQVGHQLQLVKAGKLDQGKGSIILSHPYDLSQGHEPEIAARLKLLSARVGKPIYIISGYRTPEHSVEVGGFADDPHTKGSAADIGVGSPTLASANLISEAEYESVGLHRPYGTAHGGSSAEDNHVELLNGGTPATGGGAGVAGAVGVSGAGGSAVAAAAGGVSGGTQTRPQVASRLEALPALLATLSLSPQVNIGKPEEEGEGEEGVVAQLLKRRRGRP